MKLKKISKYTLIIFMLLEPLLDLKILYSDNLINIFKFSPATIIRIIFLIFLGISSFYLFKDKIKKKHLIIFISIYLIYTIFHLYNATLFKVPISTYNNYSILSEIFYLIRIFCPLMLVFITYEEKLEYKDISKIILIVYFIFSSIMVLTNFLKIALTSYNILESKTVMYNFFSWFKPGIYDNIGSEYFASKGLFSYANSLSALLVSMLPLLIYIVLNAKFKVFNILTLFLTIMSLAMLGTRVAGLGMLLVFLVSILLYIFFKVINKDKKIWNINLFLVILIFLTFAGIYKFYPAANRLSGDDYQEGVEERIRESGADKELIKLKEEIKELKEKGEINLVKEKEIAFLEKYGNAIYDLGFYFREKAYPYTEDYEFWFQMLDVPYLERCDNRKIKSYITKHVFELNNNKLDYLVGFSFERPMNANVYMENDIIAQFYSLGILGLILFIFPYLGVLVYILIKIFKDKEKFTYLNITLCMVIMLIYFISILSGNVFDQWIVTLFLGFILGILLRNVKE